MYLTRQIIIAQNAQFNAKLTATMKRFHEFIYTCGRRIEDIALGRVRDGWPTRDAAAPEEDC